MSSAPVRIFLNKVLPEGTDFSQYNIYLGSTHITGIVGPITSAQWLGDFPRQPYLTCDISFNNNNPPPFILTSITGNNLLQDPNRNVYILPDPIPEYYGTRSSQGYIFNYVIGTGDYMPEIYLNYSQLSRVNPPSGLGISGETVTIVGSGMNTTLKVGDNPVYLFNSGTGPTAEFTITASSLYSKCTQFTGTFNGGSYYLTSSTITIPISNTTNRFDLTPVFRKPTLTINAPNLPGNVDLSNNGVYIIQNGISTNITSFPYTTETFGSYTISSVSNSDPSTIPFILLSMDTTLDGVPQPSVSGIQSAGYLYNCIFNDTSAHDVIVTLNYTPLSRVNPPSGLGSPDDTITVLGPGLGVTLKVGDAPVYLFNPTTAPNIPFTITAFPSSTTVFSGFRGSSGGAEYHNSTGLITLAISNTSNIYIITPVFSLKLSDMTLNPPPNTLVSFPTINGKYQHARLYYLEDYAFIMYVNSGNSVPDIHVADAFRNMGIFPPMNNSVFTQKDGTVTVTMNADLIAVNQSDELVGGGFPYKIYNETPSISISIYTDGAKINLVKSYNLTFPEILPLTYYKYPHVLHHKGDINTINSASNQIQFNEQRIGIITYYITSPYNFQIPVLICKDNPAVDVSNCSLTDVSGDYNIKQITEPIQLQFMARDISGSPLSYYMFKLYAYNQTGVRVGNTLYGMTDSIGSCRFTISYSAYSDYFAPTTNPVLVTYKIFAVDDTTKLASTTIAWFDPSIVPPSPLPISGAFVWAQNNASFCGLPCTVSIDCGIQQKCMFIVNDITDPANPVLVWQGLSNSAGVHNVLISSNIPGTRKYEAIAAMRCQFYIVWIANALTGITLLDNIGMFSMKVVSSIKIYGVFVYIYNMTTGQPDTRFHPEIFIYPDGIDQWAYNYSINYRNNFSSYPPASYLVAVNLLDGYGNNVLTLVANKLYKYGGYLGAITNIPMTSHTIPAPSSDPIMLTDQDLSELTTPPTGATTMVIPSSNGDIPVVQANTLVPIDFTKAGYDPATGYPKLVYNYANLYIIGYTKTPSGVSVIVVQRTDLKTIFTANNLQPGGIYYIGKQPVRLYYTK